MSIFVINYASDVEVGVNGGFNIYLISTKSRIFLEAGFWMYFSRVYVYAVINQRCDSSSKEVVHSKGGGYATIENFKGPFL